MKFQEVLVCAALALLATANAGVVPPKAGLSPKDKLALELPVKQHRTDKAGVKTEEVKVGFSTTTSTTTTTTKAPKLQRPKYVDAAVFRHQFTTPSSSSTSPSISSSTSDETSVAFLTRVLQPEEFLGQADRELGLVTDRKTESFRRGFRPASSGSLVLQPPSSSSTTTTTRTTTTSSTTTAPPHEDAASFDYDAHFILMDDLSPFGGELGVLGGDRRGEAYISIFRPPGF